MPATVTQTSSRQALRANQNRNGRPRESRAINLLNKRDRQIAALKAENAELGALIEHLHRQLNQATR
jgi:hypothetical protein